MDNLTLNCEVEIQAAAGDPAKLPTFNVKAYTGGPLRTAKYPAGIIIDLSGMEVSPDITANLHHDPTKIVGHSDQVVNDGKTLDILGTVSGTGEAAKEFIGNNGNGYRWKASVEVLPYQVEEIKAGARVTVNGQSFVGPQLVARKSKLYGVAFVSRGADEDTSVKIAAMAAGSNLGVPQMDKALQDWIIAQGFDPATLNDKQKEFLETRYAAEIKATANKGEPSQPEFDLDEIKAAFGEHVAELEIKLAEREETVPAAKHAEIKASAMKAARELKTKAIRNKWTAAKFELDAIKATSAVELALVVGERPTGPAIHASNRDVTGDVIEAAMSLSLGTPDVEKKYDEKTLETANRHFKGMGLQRAFIMAAAANGMNIGPGERIHQGNIREALRYAFQPIHASGVSTLSLSGILSNVANKQLLSGYMEEDQTWREVAAIRPVNNFLQNTSYRMLDSMAYEEIGPDGKIHHGTITEESYTNQARSYAKMFAITRTQIINDDLGAFDDIRNRLGRGAAMKFNDVFWAAFLDNSSFFTSGRGNYISGSTTTLLTDGVGLAFGVKAFRQMNSPSGDGSKRIGGNPELLLVPPELEAAAEGLYKNQNLGQVATSSANIYANKYRPVVVPWLSDSAFTGYSTTAWYLFRAPTMLAPMCVSFLNGNQSPTVETADADFDQLGVQFRGYHDFGCDKSEYLSGVKSKGAS